MPDFAGVVLRVEVGKLLEGPGQGAVVFRWVMGMVDLDEWHVGYLCAYIYI